MDGAADVDGCDVINGGGASTFLTGRGCGGHWDCAVDGECCGPGVDTVRSAVCGMQGGGGSGGCGDDGASRGSASARGGGETCGEGARE